MGKSSPSPPQPPDPAKTAAAQGAANKEAAIASAQINMVDQATPYGTVKYSQLPGTGTQYNMDAYNSAMANYNTQLANYNAQPAGTAGGGLWNGNGRTNVRTGAGTAANRGSAPIAPKMDDYKIAGGDTPRYQQTVSLSPEQQKQYDLQNGISEKSLTLGQSQLGQISDALHNPFSMSGLPSIGQLNTGNLPRLNTSVNGARGYQTNANGGDLQRGLDYSGASQMMNTGDMASERQRIEGALYDRLNPQMDRSRTALETRLANQGLAPGSEAYKNAMGDQSRAENDARLAVTQQAGNEVNNMFNQSLAGRQQGINEINTQGNFGNDAQAQAYSQALQNAGLNNSAASQEFGQNLSSAQFGNTARGQALNEGLTQANFDNATRSNALSDLLLQRSQPINELAGLLGFSSGVQMPSGAQGTGAQINPADVMGAIQSQYAGQLNNYNSAMQQNNATMGGLFGLGGSIASALPWATMLSDRRLKHDVVPLGTYKGLTWYAFRYLWDKTLRFGVMAQEAAEKFPDAVENVGGYLAVNYKALEA